jgi:L-ribulose-5-phosphate 3-epimerase
MQGRLVPPESGKFQSFPRARWRDELALAAAAQLDTIEWIYDAYGEDINPIASDFGTQELLRLSTAHNVAVESICADWFMDFPLVGASDELARPRWDRLSWLVERGAQIGINRVVLPFVDNSAIRGDVDMERVVAGIDSLSQLLIATNIELHLETDLNPEQFATLLQRLPQSWVKVNYDSGNSASLGYRPDHEFAAYGERVGSVHIKDRVLRGGTVPLGEGDTDFEVLFQALANIRYDRDFILQVARGEEGDELRWTASNVKVVREMISNLQYP